MPKLTVLIQGIALSYQKGDVWKTILPFGDPGDCHKVRYRAPEGGPGAELAEAGRVITISAKNPATAAGQGDDFDKFVDLTNPAISHEAIRLQPDWQSHGVLLVMESAVMSQGEPTRCRYYLREKGGPKNTKLGYIAYSGRAEIDAEEITISVNGTNSFSLTLEANTVLLIDNECYEEATEDTGDLALLYRYIIADADGSGRQFYLERDPQDGSAMKQLVAPLTQVMDTNPRPFFYGLPCNKFVAKDVLEN